MSLPKVPRIQIPPLRCLKCQASRPSWLPRADRNGTFYQQSQRIFKSNKTSHLTLPTAPRTHHQPLKISSCTTRPWGKYSARLRITRSTRRLMNHLNHLTNPWRIGSWCKQARSSCCLKSLRLQRLRKHLPSQPKKKVIVLNHPSPQRIEN